MPASFQPLFYPMTRFSSVFASDLCLLKATNSWVLFSNPVNLHRLTGKLRLFLLKVVFEGAGVFYGSVGCCSG